MAYKSPGVRITNQFQPIVNAAVGGDRLLAIVGKVSSNINLFPVMTLEARKESSNPDAIKPDVVKFSRPDPKLGTISDSARIISIWQGADVFNKASTNYILNALHSSSGGTDIVTSSLSIPASAANVLVIYQKTSSTVTVYEEVRDYTISLDNNGPSGALRVSVNWSPNGKEPAVNSSYTVVVEDASVDYHVVVDDTMDGEVTLKVYWGTLTDRIPETGSAYMIKTRVEFSGERQIVTSTDEVFRLFGSILDPLNPNPNNAASINELAIAAYLAFSEGAGAIMLVPYDGTTVTYTDALDALKTDDLVNIVTGIDDTQIQTGGTSLNDLIIKHVKDASSQQYQKFRIGILNPKVGNFNDAKTAYDVMAKTADSNRIIIIGPSQFTFKVPIPGTGEYVDFKTDGKYGGVIFGAMMCRPEYDVATSMLRKPSYTISKIRKEQEWDDRKLDIIAALGITLFQKQDGVYKCREDITTSQSGTIMEAEPSITMIADNIAKSAIKILDAAVIGNKLLLPTTLENIKSRLMSMLDNKTRAPSLIIGYGEPIVVVSPTDPRKIEVTIPVQPVQKVREINITFNYVASL